MKITLHISKSGSYQEEITKLLLDLAIDLQETLPELLKSISNNQDHVVLNLDIPYKKLELGRLLEFVKIQKEPYPWLTTTLQLLEYAVDSVKDHQPAYKSIRSSKVPNFNTLTPTQISEIKNNIELHIKASGGKPVAATELQQKFKLDPTRTRRLIRELVDGGKVIFTGKSRATRYYWRDAASNKIFAIYRNLCGEMSIKIPKGHVPPSPKPPSKKSRVKGPEEIKWEEQPLGEMSDYELSEILEVSRHRVNRARNKLGIAAFQGSE